MQVTEAWIAIAVRDDDSVVTAYGPFDTNGEAMRFVVVLSDIKMVVRKLRKPPSPHLWRSQKAICPSGKVTYKTRKAAMVHVRRLKNKGMEPYHCHLCENWHIANSRKD